MGKLVPLCLIIACCFASCSLWEDDAKKHLTKEELDAKFHGVWNKPEYQIAHTAQNENYLSDMEKEVFYYLNLARINPPLFAQTYVKEFTGLNGFANGYAWDERKESLIAELLEMNPLPLIYPSIELYELAYCFAYEGGQLGYRGHDRSQTSCEGGWSAECCSYGGEKNGMSIILRLLIDAGENNAALGHRRICLSENYVKMGVSNQYHKTYQHNTVLDFGRQ